MAESEKTEKATPKKRRDQRRKGNIFLARDAVSVVTLIGSFAAFWIMMDVIVDQTSRFMLYCFSLGRDPVDHIEEILAEIIYQGGMAVLRSVGPMVAITIACSLAATFYQTKFLVAWELAKPKLSRLNPLQGIKRLFSLKSLVETLKNILKIICLIVIIYFSIQDMIQESVKYLYSDVPVACGHMIGVAWDMLVRIIIAFIVLAAADTFYQHWDFERQMKMTKQEVKEEYKQMEGDPKVKGKIKEIQRRRALSRMMQQVPQADVVIRNPTHFAVALRYKPDRDNAPIVLAKGTDELALRIVQIAEENHVAVLENVPLARALYAGTELNQEIPAELYGAVAEVLVYIFRLNEKKQIVK